MVYKRINHILNFAKEELCFRRSRPLQTLRGYRLLTNPPDASVVTIDIAPIATSTASIAMLPTSMRDILVSCAGLVGTGGSKVPGRLPSTWQGGDLC